MRSVVVRCCDRGRCTSHGSSELEFRSGESQRDAVLQSRSRGIASSELPLVKMWEESATPTGLCPLGTRNTCATPLGLSRFARFFPRVARPSQPWALLRNPFGILQHPAHGSKDPCKQRGWPHSVSALTDRFTMAVN